MTVDALARNGILATGLNSLSQAGMLPLSRTHAAWSDETTTEDVLNISNVCLFTTTFEDYPTFVASHSDKKPLQRTRKSENIWQDLQGYIFLYLPHGKSKIEEVADKWLNDTKWSSSFDDIMSHPAFEQLRNAGPSSLSLAISKLRDGDLQVHWFILAKTIAGEDPSPPETRGRLPEMAKYWISWANDRAIHGKPRY